MEYKGIELKEITEPQLFDPPKKMLVWDNCDKVELDVYAIVSRKDFPVICENSTWQHCAEIPESKLKSVTYRELARWLAECNGETKSAVSVFTNLTYTVYHENDFIPESFYVRKWEDTEWHKPTREYLGLEDE